MSLDGELVLGARRYPARHAVLDGELVRGAERIPVVVKRTRTTWRQRIGETKAERSYRLANELRSRGLPTPEPLGTGANAGESWYVARRVEGAAQIRVWFLHRDDASMPAPPLDVSFEDVVRRLGALARSIHDAGVFFRDLSDGNVLVAREGGSFGLWLVDLDRVRVGPRVGAFRRLRDLARPGLNRPEDLALLMDAYQGRAPIPTMPLVLLRLFRARLVLWDDLKRRLRPWRRRDRGRVSSGLRAP